MAQKFYVTYDRKMIGSTSFIDPTQEFNYCWNPSSFEETSLVGSGDDKRLIGICHIADVHDRPDLIMKMMKKFAMYTFEQVTPAEVVTQCNEWYPAPEGEDPYFVLDADGFTIIDNRPEPELF